jgi:coiled-coil domain-containing protein 130
MQGFNMGRYVPPDLEGTTTPNRAASKPHALGSRARKLKTEGILTVRFECPFAIWCTTCHPEQIIAQGVRFNAEKKKVGNYYTTPIWGFRVKHTLCGGWIEIRTDPRNAEYVVHEGGRRRDYGGDKLLDVEVRIGGSVTEEEKERLEKDGGFAGLEKKVEDKSKATAQKERIEELFRVSGRDWRDPYERSQVLRREFRVGRRKRQDDESTGEELKERFGIEVEMLPGKEEDGERAKLIDFGDIKAKTASAKPLFRDRGTPIKKEEGVDKRSESQKYTKHITGQGKSALQTTLKSNSMSASDPFLREEKIWQPRAKRKRTEEDGTGNDAEAPTSAAFALVDYDSDFE